MNAANKRMHAKYSLDVTGLQVTAKCAGALLALHIISCTDGMLRINQSGCRCANCIASKYLIRYLDGGNKF